MKIICLVKFVLDEKKLILNPDDACALALALKLKKKHELTVEIVCMGPGTLKEPMCDLIRRGADIGTLISDSMYAGSDTFATASILQRYLKAANGDMILSGTHSLDGDTAHVPAQIAQMLDVSFMTNVVYVEEASSIEEGISCGIECEEEQISFFVKLPALVGISKESKYKLPFVRYEDLDRNVDDRLQMLTNQELNFSPQEVGVSGSKTKVVKTFAKEEEKRKQVILKNDEAGIEYVFEFLKEKGYL